jgi:putative hydrolase of the HAD superfamily
MRRLPALIFDFGNVVAHFDYRKACDHYGRRLGISADAFLERVRTAGFSELVKEYESGRIESTEFSSRVCALAGLDISHTEFAAAWADIFWLNEPIADLVAALRSLGYTLVLGSNTNDLHAAQFRGQFAETLAHFDTLVLSYEIGHIKPSADFYHACVRAAGAEPGSCIFIDDLAENVEGARAAGLRAVQFRDVPELLTELESLGVEIPGRERR